MVGEGGDTRVGRGRGGRYKSGKGDGGDTRVGRGRGEIQKWEGGRMLWTALVDLGAGWRACVRLWTALVRWLVMQMTIGPPARIRAKLLHPLLQLGIVLF